MLRVGVLCSYRAPALKYLLSVADQGRPYQIVTCIASGETFSDAAPVLSHGVPLHLHPLRCFCRNRAAALSDMNARQEYDLETCRILRRRHVDVVVTDAYLYVLTEAMLRPFARRIVNLHHSDLTLRDRDGRPRYIGLRAVRDAVLAGERETRATAHLVAPQLDGGPPFLRSWAFPVSPLVQQALEWNARDILKAYSFAHQEWMIRATWGPLMDQALRLIATGRVDLRTLVQGDPVWELDHAGALIQDETNVAHATSRLMAKAG